MKYIQTLRGNLVVLFTLGVMLSCSYAGISVSKSEFDSFVGPNRTGKIVYVKASDENAYFVDFLTGNASEKKLCDQDGVRSPLISPGGNFVTFSTGTWVKHNCGESSGNIWLCRLEQNASPVKVAEGFDPHWWMNGDDAYIVYRTTSCKCSYPCPGSTKKQKVDLETLQSVGSPQILVDAGFGGGLSKNGNWLCTAYRTVDMYNLQNEEHYELLGGSQACNSSITPSEDPSRQNRMMHLNLAMNNAGTSYHSHETFCIRDHTDQLVWFITKPDGSGEWQHPEWSTHEDFATSGAGFGGNLEPNDCDYWDIYAIQISTKATLRITNGGDYDVPHMWVGEKVTGPVLIPQSSTISFNAIKNGEPPSAQDNTVAVKNTDVSSASVSLSNAGWLTVQKNIDDSTLILTNTITTTDLSIGNHTATVTISADNADDVQYTVSLEISEAPRIEMLDLSPDLALCAPEEQKSFHVFAVDQFGNVMKDPPGITWSVTGGGSVENGVFNAGTKSNTLCTIIAGDADVRDTAHVYVTSASVIHKKINCGDNAHDVSGWERDDGYVSKGDDYVFTQDIAAAEVPNGGPEGIYQSCRHRSPHSYTFPDCKDGVYTIRIHFVVNSDDRQFTYKAEGNTILQEYNPLDDAGNTFRPVVKSFKVTVDDGNGLTLECEAGGGTVDVFETAIEVIAMPWKDLPVRVVYPNGGETFNPGETITIQWESDSVSVTDVKVLYTLNGGLNWASIVPDGSIALGDSNWSNLEWVIPADLDSSENDCMIKVNKYQGNINDVSDEFFAIEYGSSSKKRSNRIPQNPIFTMAGDGTIRCLHGSGTLISATLYTLDGRRLKVFHTDRMKADGTLGRVTTSGAYLLTWTTRQGSQNRVFIVGAE